jgi:hypothetical protein
MTRMTAPFDSPPLDPSSPEAQQWLRDELAKGEYVTEPSWWQRFLEWLMRLLDPPRGGGLSTWLMVLVVVLVLAVVAAVVLRIVRPEAVARATRRAGSGAVDEEGLRASDYRARSRTALERGDWDAALLDAYRALAAAAVERTLLVELPGRTAHEVAVSLAAAFPDHADALARAAAAFDDVRYGHRSTSQGQAHAALELDSVLLRTRPRLEPLGAP